MDTDTAAPGIRLARGVCNALRAENFAVLTEFPIRTGLRMDVLALGPTGEIWCVEVKSSRADFLSDAKWRGYLDWCERLFFAVPNDFDETLLPAEQGLIRTDDWSAAIIRRPERRALAAARRKAMTLSFARLAAERLARETSGPGHGAVVL